MNCRHAEEADFDSVSELLAEAFSEEPVHKLIFPGRQKDDLIEVLRDFFRIYVNLTQKYGDILLSENSNGALMYFKPKAMAIPEKELANIDDELRKVCTTDYPKAVKFINALEKYHPTTFEHYYISLLAIRPSYRGKGVINDLFEDFNAILDKENLPCYAECTRFSTRTLIRRWGYNDLGSPIMINGFPNLYPVIRYPNL